MDSMAKYLSKIDQKLIEEPRRKQLALERNYLNKSWNSTRSLKVNRCQTQIKTLVMWKTKSIGPVAKLPKLRITKFNGTSLDWTRFWGQFTEGIDKSSMAAITKFSLPERICHTQSKKKYRWLAIYPRGIWEANEHFEGTLWKWQRSGEGLCEGYPRTAKG